MDTLTLLKKLIASKNEFAEAVLGNLTEENLNWTPPVTANSIGVNLIHVSGGDDYFLQECIQQKPMVWSTGGWAEKIGLAIPPGSTPESWKIAKTTHLPLQPVLAYYRAVCAVTDTYFEQLTEVEIDRPVMMFGKPSNVGEFLVMILTHATEHLGEIAALKGVQGCKGLPF